MRSAEGCESCDVGRCHRVMGLSRVHVAAAASVKKLAEVDLVDIERQRERLERIDARPQDDDVNTCLYAGGRSHNAITRRPVFA